MKRHESMNERVKQEGRPGADRRLITHGWEGKGNRSGQVLRRRNAVNLGIGGDQTQHVLCPRTATWQASRRSWPCS